MKNWPNDPPAEQMPKARPCFSLGALRMMAPRTGLKEAADRPMPLRILPITSMVPLCIVAITSMPRT